MTLGILQGGRNSEENEIIISKDRGYGKDNKLGGTAGKYHGLPQDTTRTLIEQDLILDDLDYTSAPIAAEKVLQENSPVRRKY